MAPQTETTRKIDGTLAAVLGHPLRCRIMAVLDTRVASPAELSREWNLPVGTVSYHANRLVKLGYLEQVGSRQVRGATERFFKNASGQRTELDSEEYATLSLEERTVVALEVLQLLTADAGTAVDSRTISERTDSTLIRTPGYVDEEGWSALNEIFAEAGQKVYDVMAESAGRGRADIPITASVLCFEMPEGWAKKG